MTPEETPSGRWSITHNGERLTFPTEQAARVGQMLHEQADRADKRHDGISPAKASTEGE